MARAKPASAAARPTFFATPQTFRSWLAAHHADASELLVGFYKKGSGKPSITWPESVDEALCFGWIDGVRRNLNDEAYTIRFTPRRPTSIWSAINVAKVKKLSELGKMHECGLAAFAARREDKTGVYSFERNRAAELSPEQASALYENSKAAAFFEAQPPWYRRTAIHWVISAKREETRARRLSQLIADSESGRTIAPLKRPNGSSPSAKAKPATKRTKKSARAR